VNCIFCFLKFSTLCPVDPIVGAGSSTIVKSAGKGVGQIVGGGETYLQFGCMNICTPIFLIFSPIFILMFTSVSGGLLLAAKGIGKGVIHGDGKAVASGLGDGVVSIGSGVIDGAESVVTGTAQGVFSVGKGLFTGLQTMGKGVGKAVTGENSKWKRKGTSRHN